MVRFEDALKRAVIEIEGLTKDIVTTAVELTADSIVNGSSVTGSPGQPADLRDGAWKTQHLSDYYAVISTTAKSARSVEDGMSYKHGRPLTKLHSDIGGFHSALATAAAFPRLLSEAVKKNGGKSGA